MTATQLTRRRLLKTSLALGCSAAASPLVTPITFAAAPGDARLVVIVLRGAMDGLDVVQPVGDPLLRQHRANLSKGEAGGCDFFESLLLFEHPKKSRLHNGNRHSRG